MRGFVARYKGKDGTNDRHVGRAAPGMGIVYRRFLRKVSWESCRRRKLVASARLKKDFSKVQHAAMASKGVCAKPEHFSKNIFTLSIPHHNGYY